MAGASIVELSMKKINNRNTQSINGLSSIESDGRRCLGI